MAHEQRSDRGRLVIEKRMEYIWAILPESIAAQDYTTVEEAIEKNLAGENDRVVIDFINVHALYSSGLGILIRLQKRVEKTGGVIALVNVSQKIEDMLVSLHLDKVFPLYSTDIEFEISRDDLWGRRMAERKEDFLFFFQVEKNLCRITLSGEMVSGRDMSPCRQFVPDPGIRHFILDLSFLEAMDSSGAGIFMNMLHQIRQHGGRCHAFGTVKEVRQVLTFLGAEQFLTFLGSEKDALAGLFA
ncbi:MAG: STAS domain-containing protein [Chitinispirillaceae bacterium]|nr:STAS domain-containing protein [Chitinispirillaceae bacterium]